MPPFMKEASWQSLHSDFQVVCSFLAGLAEPDKDWTLESEKSNHQLRHLYRHVFRPTENPDLLESAITGILELTPVLTGHFDRREMSPAFVQDWGQFQYFAGILMANRMGSGDGLQAARGGKKSGLIPREDSLDLRRRIHVKALQFTNQDLSQHALKRLLLPHFPEIKERAMRDHLSALGYGKKKVGS